MKKLSPYSYYEISLQTAALNEATQTQAVDFFTGCGVPWQDIVFSELENQSCVTVYTRSRRQLIQIRKKASKMLGGNFRLKVKLLIKEDWFDKWQLDYQIMPIGRCFTLVPFWQIRKYKPSAGRMPVFLDPKGASGSGQHPTTQIMTAFLEQIAGKFQNCLDLGTGTGVLAILAAKLGAQQVSAVDNDPVAVKAAKFNLRYNQVPNFEVKAGDVTRKDNKVRRYSLVCANLISPVLDSIRRELFASVKPGGYLAVSGIHVQNFQWFRKRFRDKRFRCLKIMKKRGWTGFLFKRL